MIVDLDHTQLQFIQELLQRERAKFTGPAIQIPPVYVSAVINPTLTKIDDALKGGGAELKVPKAKARLAASGQHRPAPVTDHADRVDHAVTKARSLHALKAMDQYRQEAAKLQLRLTDAMSLIQLRVTNLDHEDIVQMMPSIPRLHIKAFLALTGGITAMAKKKREGQVRETYIRHALRKSAYKSMIASEDHITLFK
jgi:hypothetical protein